MLPLDTAGSDSSEAGLQSAAYPRPQFVREDWLSLDGKWEFSRSSPSAAAPGPEVAWNERINVPFAVEAPLSGIGDESYQGVLWYRREFEVPSEWSGRRVVLHFGAVDYSAAVWVNGHLVARHEGGHTPFRADVTDQLRPGRQELIVRVEDDPHDMGKPRGKQDWLPTPHSIWYPRTSGIWQSVWLEPVPVAHVERVAFTADVAGFAVAVEATVAGFRSDEGLELDVTLSLGGHLLARDTWAVRVRTVRRRIDIPDPGIGDARNEFLWSPEHPALIDVEFRLRRGDTVLDRVRSYTALREVGARDGRFLLNGRPYFLRLALDQGYWRDGLMTAPDPAALRRDVELAKELGFNGVRKHQKIEDPRYLYWADRLGLLVWEELPSAYAFTEESLRRLTLEWMDAIERDRNHPCIVAWVPFNESWGVPDLPASARQRDAVRALRALTSALDPSRVVIGNDGWEFVDGDLFTVHDYTADAETLRLRYENRDAVMAAVDSFRPGGHSLRLQGADPEDRPVVLSEFGGIRFSSDAEGWGYSEVRSAGELLEKYRAIVRAASGEGLAGFCYTQLTDTFQEQNGLLTMERTPKADPAALARATRGEPE